MTVPGLNVRLAKITVDCRDTSLVGTFWSLNRTVMLVQQLGGRSPNRRHEHDEGTVVVMADPEGNEFCLVWHVA